MRRIISWLCVGGVLIGLNRPRTPETIDAQTLIEIESIYEIDTQTLWPGYEIDHFPIDVYYSQVLEFRYRDGEIQSQFPTLDNFALTIDVEEDQPILKVTNIEQWELMTNYGQRNYQDARQYYQSLIIHEGFHGFQHEEGYLDYVVGRLSRMNLTGPESILLTLDNDEDYRKLWLQEQDALMDYYFDGLKEKKDWLDTRQIREDYLIEILEADQVKSFLEWEALIESVEGEARYIELLVSRDVIPEDLSIEVDSFYSSGIEKFYQGKQNFTNLLMEL